jgi:hypothetical protein
MFVTARHTYRARKIAVIGTSRVLVGIPPRLAVSGV